MRTVGTFALVLAAACSVAPEEELQRPEPLAALPPPSAVETERFRDAEACGQCHLVKDDTPVLHDATGANVSPVLLWRSSLMALAARDPFYLAVFAEEIARAPDRKAEIDATCTRCHAPAGSEQRAAMGAHLSFEELVAGTSPAAILGRGGVTCTLCHQISASSVGDAAFTGKFGVGYGRQLFGPYANPVVMPMELIVNFTPTYGAHVQQSALCATCHTVIIPTPSGEVVEQATFLEWRSSSFSPGQPCQACHVASVDHDGVAISTPVASFPASLGARQPVGRHDFVGGNSYVLRLIADAVEWSGADIDKAEILASADRNDAHLATAGRVSIRELRREGQDLVAVVSVENLTGHKLPTGYPSRRVWLHVKVTAGGQTVFESGAPGTLPVQQPHHDVVTSPDEVQIYEPNLVDLNGHGTHRALDARRYSKDNRLLPKGFNPQGVDRVRTEVLGTSGDTTFVAGMDDVTYRIAAPAGASVEVALLYQSLRPEIIEAIEASRTPAGSRFVDLARARPMTPVTIARTAGTAP
jgi:hypothetical protein